MKNKNKMKQIYTNLRKIFAIAIILFVQGAFSGINAQTGYIYVHSKALNEIGSPNITFSVSGGSTSVPNFTLNDDPAQLSAFFDIGASENGRLWAACNGGALYYRNVNSTVWVNTSITGVARVDGGPGGTCYFLNSAGTAFSYDAVSAQVQISGTAVFANGGGWNDIGSGWTGTPTSSNTTGPALYVVEDDGNIYKWSGSGTTWNVYATIATSAQYRIDVNPTNGNVYVGGNIGTVRTIRQITPAATPVITSLGSPVADNQAYRDVAVTQNGEIYATAYNQIAPVGWFVHKFVSGTTWTRELGSFDAQRITGGVDNSLWSTMNSGGQNGGSGWVPAAGPYPFYNIFTRAFDGTSSIYIDDERVRTTVGNSQLIPVAPGTYTITETIPGGWDLQKILVYDPSANSSSNQVAGTATITVAADEVVNVVFQTGELNPIAMTNNCSQAYLETFGVGTSVGTATTAGSFGAPVAGQTSYHYLAGNGPGEDGYYKIVNRANPDFNGWGGAAGIVDHTPGDGALGYMYAVNAGFDKGEFFRRRFTGVIPGATYNFSAWIIDLTASAATNPNVSFTVYDHTTQAVLGTYNTGELTSTVEPDSWQQYGFSFVATAADIDLVVGNNGFGGNGNDLAIDDISFALIPGAVPITTVANTGCGTLGSITITSPIGASYEYSRDGFATAAQSSPVFPNLAPGTYTISARFVGTVGCVSSKVDVIGATICGNVWNDANGNAINSGENPITSGVWVNLVDPITNDVIQSVQVDASGNYSFTGLPQNTSYQIILTTSNQTGNTNLTTATLPTGYIATGTNLSSVANTANNTGVITVNTGAGGITQQNFGLEGLPNSDPKTQMIPYPTGGVITAGTVSTAVSGIDPEDGTLGNSNTIVITTLPTNATMYYNFGSGPVAVVPGQTITGFNPAMLSFTGISNGSTQVLFQYAFVDAAGEQDPTPANYILSWANFAPLPIKLQSFTIKASSCNATELSWKVSDAVNFSHFEIERSFNGGAFETSATILYTSGSVLYTAKQTNLPAGKYQYRLKMVDADGKSQLSQISFIRLGCGQETKILVYPNPVKDKVTINGLKGGETIALYNATGQLVLNRKTTEYQISIDMANLTTGTYYIKITDKNGEKISESKIVKVN